MNNIPNVEKKINEMYDKAKYLDKYGGSYYGTWLLFIVFVFVIGYLLIQITIYHYTAVFSFARRVN